LVEVSAAADLEGTRRFALARNRAAAS